MTNTLIGQELANFRIEKHLGRGGMADVYYGIDINLERPVALKVVDARHRDDPGYAKRFVREAQAIAKLRHEHVIQVYQAGEVEGLYYFAMEFIDGQGLDELLAEYKEKKQRLAFTEALRIGRAFASALDYAHEQGIVHRDVKPSNLLIGQDERITLTDFGLAMDVEQGSMGEVFGSALYIAPEQARRSSDAVPQSDLYSLGIIMYEILTGRVPFDDPSPTAAAVQHLTVEPPHPHEFNPDLTEETAHVLLKALNKKPDERYQTGQAYLDALERALLGETIVDRPDSTKALEAKPAVSLANIESLTGQQLDEYKLESLLGHGGMARVYKGVDINLERHAAIKVIDTPFRDNEDYETRFKLEAKAIAQLEHANIVRIYRYGKVNDLLYIAMQFIEGENLHTMLVQHRQEETFMARDEVLRIIRIVCEALDYAHSKNVIHRDVKPSNIMVNEAGNVFLTDFGLALLTEVGTRGEILGSPHYIAPEQAMSSASVVNTSDLYAVGVILFQMLTNQIPFDAVEPLDIAMLHMSETPPNPTDLRADITPALEAVVLKALAKKPEQRYQTGEELASALEGVWSEEVIEATAPPPVDVADQPPQPKPIKESSKKDKPTPGLPKAKLPDLPPIPAVMARQDKSQSSREPSIMSKIAQETAVPQLTNKSGNGKNWLPYAALAGVLLLLCLAGIWVMSGTAEPEATTLVETETPAESEIAQAEAVDTITPEPTSTPLNASAAADFQAPSATEQSVDTTAPLETETPTATATSSPTPTPDTSDENLLGYLPAWSGGITGTLSYGGEKWFLLESSRDQNESFVTVFVNGSHPVRMIIYDKANFGPPPPRKVDETPNRGEGDTRDRDGRAETVESSWYAGGLPPGTQFYVRLINQADRPIEYCFMTRGDEANWCPW